MSSPFPAAREQATPKISDELVHAYLAGYWQRPGVEYEASAGAHRVRDGLTAAYPLIEAAALAAREAEVRRKVADEIRTLFADPWRAKEFLNGHGLTFSCGPGTAALAIAAAVESGGA